MKIFSNDFLFNYFFSYFRLKAEAKSINMSPNSAMVLTYVPKEK